MCEICNFSVNGKQGTGKEKVQLQVLEIVLPKGWRKSKNRRINKKHLKKYGVAGRMLTLSVPKTRVENL